MMTQVQKRIELTVHDFIYRAVYAQLSSISKLLFPLFLAALFVAALIINRLTQQHVLLLLLSALPFLMYLISLAVFIPKNAAADFWSSSYANKKPLCTIDAEHVTIERESGNLSEIRWQDLTGAWESRKYFYFHITAGNSIILPKRQMDAEEIRTVHDFIRAHATPAARKNPYRVPPKRLIRNIVIFLVIAISVAMVIWSYFYAPQLLPEELR